MTIKTPVVEMPVEPGTLFATAESTLLKPYQLDSGKLQQVLGRVMAHRADYADLYFQ